MAWTTVPAVGMQESGRQADTLMQTHVLSTRPGMPQVTLNIELGARCVARVRSLGGSDRELGRLLFWA